MSKEKQIEEMTEEIRDIYADLVEGGITEYESECLATNLYNAGYRKQSEGEWDEINKCNGVIATFVHGGGRGCGYVYKTYRHPLENCKKSLPRFCPACGAKMKGGAE